MKLNRKNRKAFTIVELVIVVGVIGILSAILIPTFANLTSKAQDSALKSDLAAVYASYVADVADGYYGSGSSSDSAASKMYAQTEVALIKTADIDQADSGTVFYVYENNAWNTTAKTKADSHAIARLGTESYSGYAVYNIVA